MVPNPTAADRPEGLSLDSLEEVGRRMNDDRLNQPVHRFGSGPDRRMMRLRSRVVVVCLLLASACGGDSKTGSTTGPSPNIPNVAGIWRGSERTTSVTGGDCIGPTLQSSV